MCLSIHCPIFENSRNYAIRVLGVGHLGGYSHAGSPVLISGIPFLTSRAFPILRAGRVCKRNAQIQPQIPRLMRKGILWNEIPTIQWSKSADRIDSFLLGRIQRREIINGSISWFVQTVVTQNSSREKEEEEEALGGDHDVFVLAQIGKCQELSNFQELWSQERREPMENSIEFNQNSIEFNHRKFNHKRKVRIQSARKMERNFLQRARPGFVPMVVMTLLILGTTPCNRCIFTKGRSRLIS